MQLKQLLSMRVFIGFVLFFSLELCFGQKVIWETSSHYKNFTEASGCSIDQQGNCFVSGVFGGYKSGESGLFIHKYSPDGSLLWADTSGCTFGVNDGGGVKVDRFGNSFTSVFVAWQSGIRFGNQYYPGFNMYLLKYDPQGHLLWAKADGQGEPLSMASDEFDHIYVSGGGFTKKYDLDGNCLLTIPYGGYKVSVDKDENLYFSGRKYDQAGKLIFKNKDELMTAETDGSYYLCYQDSIVKKISSSQRLWSASFPPMGPLAIFTDRNILYLAGNYYDSTSSIVKTRILSYTQSGIFRWSYSYAPKENSQEKRLTARDLYVQDGYILLTGYLEQQAGGGILLKMNDNDTTGVYNSVPRYEELIFSISPNPGTHFRFTGKSFASTQMTISDVTGKVLRTDDYPADFSSHEIILDLSNQKPGVYFATISNGQRTYRRKLVVE
jgi:hypothetical protein